MRLVIFAASSPFASEVIETVGRLGYEVAACVRNLPGLALPEEVVNPVEVGDIDDALRQLPFVVPLTTPRHRRAAVQDAIARGFHREAMVLDPTAVIARSSLLGTGTYVNAGATIAAGVRAGRWLSVNRSASIGHHNRLGDFVTIGPGALTGGECRIDDGAFLGVGAVLAPRVLVGSGAVVGAGSVVVHDVPPDTVVVGNPARPLQKR